MDVYASKEKYGLGATPFFATANIDGIFVFSPVEKPEDFINVGACREGRYEGAMKPGKYYELLKNYRLRYYRPSETGVQGLPEDVARSWVNRTGINQLRVNLDNWFIELGFGARPHGTSPRRGSAGK
ncbi:MAG: hypothetical protein RXR06_02815 [Thermoproteus sp.]